ncbi:MAG: ATP-binding cassette domain-containing protein [Candidatus Aminicenantes bacterium]|nr:ATP-binding cassette domain-containing protein [Candidatus Aminicenantes bacterium]
MTDRNHENILTVKNLSKRFGHVEVLKNVKLSLGLGEIYAIIGPNGAGKTTLFNLITGIIEKDAGDVLYYNNLVIGGGVSGRVVKENLVSGGGVSGGMVKEDLVSGDLVSGGGVSGGSLVTGRVVSGRVGKEDVVNGGKIDITGYKPYEIARIGIGRTFQGNRVFGNMTVLENVMFAKQLIEIENPIALIKTNHKKLLKELKDKNNLVSQEKEATNLEDFLRIEAEYWLDFVGLKEKAGNKAEELSYGQQKLLSIARLLMADSRLLLFDEPTAGVNPKYSVRIAEIFRKIVEKGEKTILFIEHDMKFIQELGCKCLYMEEGKCPWPFFELEVIMKNPDIRRKFMGM